MSKKRYPITTPWEKSNTRGWFLAAGRACDTCPHVFGKAEDFWRRETRYSYMRGEDEVELQCCTCRAEGK